MFCPKCGSQVSENVKFCGKCGAEIVQAADDASPNLSSASVPNAVQLTQTLSLSPKLLGAAAGFSLFFLYYLINYLGAWSLTFSGFLTYLAVPVLFVGIILTGSKDSDKYILFAAPFGLRALMSVFFLLRAIFSSHHSMSFQGWLTHGVHIALAVLYCLTILGRFSGKKIILILSGTAAVVLGILSFRSGFFSGLTQIVYFASTLVLIMELDIERKGMSQF
jgi:hypothetical protein